MQHLTEQAKKIRLAIFDVDGIFTDGSLFYSADGTEHKQFNVLDGQGIKLLQLSGVGIAIITSRTSVAVTKRMQDLGITHVYQNQHEKLTAYEELKNKLHLTDAEIAYTGDDLPDLPLLRRAGLSITVPHAPLIVRQHALGMTEAAGGRGAVREICDFILQAQGTFDRVIQHFLI